ncbi:MAG: tRNA (adenosine(37)-N6)-threonylcarbamoyltransferase complex ATPase subunit type 1 TsaE [Clostridia bacterium]|nr:tRNA (adenosine(37)-N6)-threonylcarbamoyltransferase complex ATPase subunit type 1 TsaE [Clostridia bacterium]
MKFVTTSEKDTLAFAGRLAGMLQPGDTVLLHGDLGAGKSVFARGVARGMGVQGAMPSPTFTLLIPYEGRHKFYHFDLYRLNDPDEFYAAGLDEFIGGDGVAIVEWPEMADIEPEPALEVSIERGSSMDERSIFIENYGVAGFAPEALAEWRKDL